MANVLHSALTTTNLHEPKGADAASAGMVYRADGAGSGAWTYLPTGWGNYADNAGTQVFNTTPAKLSIDGAGSTTDENYLPRAIRGSASLWDTTNDVITPIGVGDAYDVRLNLPVTAESGSPTELTIEFDIGGGAYGAATIIARRFAGTGKSTPYTFTTTTGLFSLATFLSNGCQIWLTANTGTVTITNPSILITRIHAGDF